MNASSIFLFFLISFTSGQILTPKLLGTLIKVKAFAIIDKTVNKQCSTDLKLLVSALEKNELWALKMLDASAKLGPGLLEGNIYQVGSYDECLKINEKVNGHEIIGKYCNVVLKPNKNFPLAKLGVSQIVSNTFLNATNFLRAVFDICIPKSCSDQDLNRLWDTVKVFIKSLPIDAFLNEELCYYKNKPVSFDSTDFFVFSFFSIVAAVVLCSTAYEIYFQQTGGKPKRVFLVFSLYTNTKKLFSTKVENENLTCLYGIKVIAMILIIGGHMACMKTALAGTNSILFFSDWAKQWRNSFFLGSFYNVESFFCIGGFLVSYLQLKYSEKLRINLFLFYAHRILRLLPALFAVILVYLSVIKYLGDGPFWTLMLKIFVNNCHDNWWATLLFFSNYLPLMDQCVPQAWYISVDSQLYLVAPLIILCLKKYTHNTLIVLAISFLICLIYTFAITMSENFGTVLFFNNDLNFMKHFHLAPVAHFPSWLCGILFGYLLYCQNMKKIVLSKKQNVMLLTLSVFTIILLNLTCTVMIRIGRVPFYSALFNCFARPIWCLALSYIIFSCSTENGGSINTFLSHPVFIVLGKLTYSMFLTHVAVICVVYLGIKRQSTTISVFSLFIDFWGVFLVTILCSMLLSLVFETPVMNMLRLVKTDEYSRKKLSV